MAQPSGRLYFLDSLRGLAALYVVLFHVLLVPHPQPNIPSKLVTQFVHFGGTGVFLFFAISGYSLSLTLPRHDRTSRPVLSYGLSRFFRIGPLFYFALTASLIGYTLVLHQWLAKSAIALNLTFLFNLVPDRQGGIVWASWTIGVEMVFYAAFLPLVRAPLALQLLSGGAAVVAFIVERSLVTPDYAYFSFLGYFPLFQMGMWAFALYEHWKAAPRAIERGAWAVAVGIAILMICASTPLAEKNVNLRLPIGFGYAALLVGCGLSLPALLEARLLRFYGKISFSVYLIHAPTIFALSNEFKWIAERTFPWATFPLCAALTILLITPCAYLTYILIEVPGERVGANVIRRLTKVSSKRMDEVGSNGALVVDAPDPPRF